MPKAMIVWGGWDGHQPEESARLVAGLLAAEGFEVSVESDYGVMSDPAIHDLDLFVPIVTGAAPVTAEAIDNLERAVRNGTGLGGHHAALSTSFRGHVKFNFMAGSQWVAHPGDIITWRVDIDRPDDPIMAGIAPFEHVSEQYYLHVDPAVEVLASTVFSGEHCPWRAGTRMPVVYKTRYGAGRVFYSALGHIPAEFERPELRTILTRGLLWAAA
jgi:type 1 glutamine amidotransferase